MNTILGEQRLCIDMVCCFFWGIYIPGTQLTSIFEGQPSKQGLNSNPNKGHQIPSGQVFFLLRTGGVSYFISVFVGLKP